MKLFGRHRKDCGCCPGHDKVPGDKYSNRRSVKAYRRDTKKAHRRGRRVARIALHCGAI